MKLPVMSQADRSIRCSDCKGFGYLPTDTPLHRLPCERCKGSGVGHSYRFHPPREWSSQPLDVCLRRKAGNARRVMKAVARCLKHPNYSRAEMLGPREQ